MSEGPRDYEFHFDGSNELEEQVERARAVLARLAAHLAATEPHRDVNLKDVVEQQHVIRAAELFFGSGTSPSPGTAHSVFISYSDRDKEFVRELSAKLDAARITTFVADRDIQLASDWAEKIWRPFEAAECLCRS